ncbi:MAG: DNA polymerase III delta subunit [uncultured Truepera sp.]|uniref:DNA-directed DNA polymerase n=1 Tax=uncultured Truepera sp. TaxID=543023 RepID=A0A6J4V4Z3_9DEIN|nr:MAG: DNA polymerase III delta subunit [uncultured Truepera sp.]
MILSFSGDPFLATRAARRALRARGFRAEETTELGEGMSAQGVAQLAAQSGLFGQVALLLDFDAAFKGQGGVKPRNEVLKVLEGVSPETLVVVLDLGATPARQKTYTALGSHENLPTPRFNALTHWVRQELGVAEVETEKDVPDTLADLFGEDLPGIAAEIQKLAVLDETLTSERVRMIVNRPASRDAFDLIEAISNADARRALSVLRSLMAQGEAPPRVLGALTWQYTLVARCVGLQEGRARVDAGLVAQTLKVKPFVAQKALALSKNLDEAGLKRVLTSLLRADVAMKTGKDEVWALESLALELSTPPPRARV